MNVHGVIDEDSGRAAFDSVTELVIDGECLCCSDLCCTCGKEQLTASVCVVPIFAARVARNS